MLLYNNVPNVLILIVNLTFDYFVCSRLILCSQEERARELDEIQFFSSPHDKAQSLFLIIALWTVS